MDLRARHLLCIALSLALGACATMAPRPEQPPGAPPTVVQGPGRYEALRTPETVAELRAAPAPDHAEVVDSQSATGDERILAAKGYVRIADGYYAGNDEKAREWLLARARDAGADRVQLYTETPNDTPALHAAYYVKFKLPFGAQFRDLHADEREAIGGAGGVSLGEIVGNSPADQANLRKGDIVLAFNRQAVRNRAHFQELLRAHMGKRVTLTLSRDGESLTRLVRLGVLASEAAGIK